MYYKALKMYCHLCAKRKKNLNEFEEFSEQ